MPAPDLAEILFGSTDKPVHERIEESWVKTHNDDQIVIPIGYTNTGGVVELSLGKSLHRNGNIIVCQGNAGGGKTVLLQNIIASITSKYSSNRVILSVLDAGVIKDTDKAMIASLPHTKIMCEGALRGPSAAENISATLKPIDSLIRERETTLMASGARSWNEHNTSQKYSQIPELVIIAHDFDYHLNKQFHEKINNLLKSIIHQGRSLGLKLLYWAENLSYLCDSLHVRPCVLSFKTSQPAFGIQKSILDDLPIGPGNAILTTPTESGETHIPFTTFPPSWTNLSRENVRKSL